MKLVIVESPSKAKTISKYLGKDYIIRASVGHVRDLPKSNKDAVDIENGFKPHYEINPDKEKVIQELEQLSKKSKEVILATDPDREGEAIAWHIVKAIDLENPKRVAFNEITQEAILKAMEKPRKIDQSLRRAQEARRVLDRIFGYELSGLIWKKVRYGLSAGRVQSPALRIIMEKEREIRAFESHKFWIITADVENKDKQEFNLTCSEEPTDEKIVKEILKAGKKYNWIVENIKKTNASKAPRAPFITSTLQQTASSRFGFAPARTMSLAQKLYEAGLITYMRTDSTHLSSAAQKQIARTIKSNFGDNYYVPKTFSKKSKNAQEAHEAIRPTNFSKKEAGVSGDQKKLYRLIWQRTIASQMAKAKILRTKILVQINHKIKIPATSKFSNSKTSNQKKVEMGLRSKLSGQENVETGLRPVSKEGQIWKPTFFINGSQILFDGWYKADPTARKEDVELPKVEVGEKLKLNEIHNEERETQPPNRYSEAGLVKELEKRGIGRPSTYASIIKTIQDRGYVERINKALHPTDTGEVVSDFLEKNFDSYISDSFTAEMENTLDEIAKGEKGYKRTLTAFYKPFMKEIKSKEDLKKITDLGKADAKFKCPKCKKSMIIKLGKTGKFMSCSKFPDCDGARTIEGKELQGPKETGENCPECGGKLVEREGRFGKFISCSNYPKCKFIKGDPEEEKKAKTGVKCPVCGDGEMVERRGRFGPFFSCSAYPKCRHAIKAKPTGKICKFKREDKDGKVCGALMMEGTKTIPERCSDKTCPNHNPHKL